MGREPRAGGADLGALDPHLSDAGGSVAVQALVKRYGGAAAVEDVFTQAGT